MHLGRKIKGLSYKIDVGKKGYNKFPLMHEVRKKSMAKMNYKIHRLNERK